MEGSPLTERKKQGGPIVICELTAFLIGHCDRLVYINISDGGSLVFQPIYTWHYQKLQNLKAHEHYCAKAYPFAAVFSQLTILTADCLRHTVQMVGVETIWELHTKKLFVVLIALRSGAIDVARTFLA